MRSFVKRIVTENLVSNYYTMKKYAPRAIVVPVVKADAYGHSTRLVVDALLSEGVDFFAVAFSCEALQLRKDYPQIRILMMGIPEKEDIRLLVQEKIDLAVSDWLTFKHIITVGKELKCYPRIHIKVDTGINRLGFRYDSCQQIVEFCQNISDVELVGIMSHFACSDEPSHPLNRVQIARFWKCIEIFKQAGISFMYQHICNSGGVLNFPEAHYSMVRIGICLYGYSPNINKAISQLKPVMEIEGKLSFVKSVKEGETVSYGATWRVPEDGYIAVIPIGYGDGYYRLLSNGHGKVIVNGKLYSISGRICMDQFMIFARDNIFSTGDRVQILGANGKHRVSANDIARVVGSIPYETLCQFLPRLPTVKA